MDKKMKRAAWRWFGVTFMAVLVGLAGVSCTGNGNAGKQQQTAADTGGDSTKQQQAVADSVCYVVNEKHLQCKFYAEPAEERLRLAVGEWVDEQLGGYYPGDATDMQTLVDFYGRSIGDSLRSNLKELPEGFNIAYEFHMEKVYETDKVVTYTIMRYLDLGGVHPSIVEQGVTFRKSDGRRLSWDIIRNPLLNNFKDVLKKLLMDYFNVADDEGLKEALFDGKNVYDLPLPDTPPYMTEEGVVVIYQQYEIAAYASGMPGGAIPYKRIKPLMTEWAKRLIP